MTASLPSFDKGRSAQSGHQVREITAMLISKFILNLFSILSAVAVMSSCTQSENKIEKNVYTQKYSQKKIVLGSFKAEEGKPYGTADQRGVHWMTMGKGALSVDDSGKIYVLSGAKVMVYSQDGKFNNEVTLSDIGSEYNAKSLEVSADGTRLYVRLEKKESAKYNVYDVKGALIEAKDDIGFIKRGCNDIFIAEKYGVSKNAIEKIGLFALDKKLDVIKNLTDYYMTNIRLNERPVGFFDSAFNYYYMGYASDVSKIDTDGKLVSKKKVLYQGRNWRLIGIDKTANLYALAVTGNHNSIVKIDGNLEVLASISLEELAKNLENVDSMQSDGKEVQNFLVTCNGTIYFIPSNYDSINPAFEYAYKEYKKRGEYSIYRFQQSEK